MSQTQVIFLCDDGSGGRELRACDLPACSSSHVVHGALSVNANPVAADFASSRGFYAVETPYDAQTGGGIFDDTGALVSTVNQPAPGALLVESGYLYWLNSGTYTNDNVDKNGGVRRAKLSPQGQEEIVTGVSARYVDCGGLAVDGFNVYFTGQDILVGGPRSVLVAPKGGGGFIAVFALATSSGHVASDGTNVYFDSAPAIRYCARAAGCGTTPSTLVANEGIPYTDFSLANGALLFGRGDGAIRRIVLP